MNLHLAQCCSLAYSELTPQPFSLQVLRALIKSAPSGGMCFTGKFTSQCRLFSLSTLLAFPPSPLVLPGSPFMHWLYVPPYRLLPLPHTHTHTPLTTICTPSSMSFAYYPPASLVIHFPFLISVPSESPGHSLEIPYTTTCHCLCLSSPA